MSNQGPCPRTTQLQAWARRIQAGDVSAGDELVRVCGGRLHAMTAKMLRSFPAVRRWEQTEDVLQNALLRLLRALEVISPESTRRFYGLAAEQIRRELLDLARRYQRPQGVSANSRNWPPAGGRARRARRGAESGPGAEDFARWCAFHAAVEGLPAEEREVVGQVFYHGWSQAEVAELFGVGVRTVQRWWQRALLKLSAQLRREEGAG